jgi:hypothetical protein
MRLLEPRSLKVVLSVAVFAESEVASIVAFARPAFFNSLLLFTGYDFFGNLF